MALMVMLASCAESHKGALVAEGQDSHGILENSILQSDQAESSIIKECAFETNFSPI